MLVLSFVGLRIYLEGYSLIFMMKSMYCVFRDIVFLWNLILFFGWFNLVFIIFLMVRCLFFCRIFGLVVKFCCEDLISREYYINVVVVVIILFSFVFFFVVIVYILLCGFIIICWIIFFLGSMCFYFFDFKLCCSEFFYANNYVCI